MWRHAPHLELCNAWALRRQQLGGLRVSLSSNPEDPDVCLQGEVGEVYLCSRQLALGYNKNTKATDEKFKTLPATGERIYRTGDLGRWAPFDLGLDILGRAGDDGMVKVRW